MKSQPHVLQLRQGVRLAGQPPLRPTSRTDGGGALQRPEGDGISRTAGSALLDHQGDELGAAQHQHDHDRGDDAQPRKVSGEERHLVERNAWIGILDLHASGRLASRRLLPRRCQRQLDRTYGGLGTAPHRLGPGARLLRGRLRRRLACCRSRPPSCLLASLCLPGHVTVSLPERDGHGPPKPSRSRARRQADSDGPCSTTGCYKTCCERLPVIARTDTEGDVNYEI